ncbi:MAG: cation transporter [Clostridia bacterium]|nr:cation transporter [Clostridia bacterium]
MKSIVILYAGFDAMRNSVEKLIHPEPNDYSLVTLIVVAGAVLVKIFVGRYTEKQGKRADSQALIASGKDALNDAVISLATLVAAIVYIKTGYSIEAWVSAIIR